MKISLVALIVVLATASAELRGFADEDSNLSLLEEDVHHERGLQSYKQGLQSPAITHTYLSYSYKLDATKPMFLKDGPKLFDLLKEDIHSESKPAARKTTSTTESSSDLSDQLSASVGLGVGFGAFAASASFSTESMNKKKKKYTRMNKYIKIRKDVLTMKTLYPHKKLTPEAKDFLLTQTPQKIMDEMGSFYATKVTVGGIFQLSAVYEMMEKQSSSSIKTKFEASYSTFVKVNAGFDEGNSESSSCTNTESEILALGGDPTIWLKNAEPEVLQNEWVKTIKSGTYHPTDYDLKPIWKLLEPADMDPAKAEQVKTYMTKQWNEGKLEAQRKEDQYQVVKTKETPGKVTIYQPREEKGDYKERSITKDACNFVDGGFWNLDTLICGDSTRCLKWGDHCYAGRIDLPEGIKVTTYDGWNSQSRKLIDIEGPKQKKSFWNFNSRTCGFRFTLVDTKKYTCGELKCSTD